MIGTRGSDWLGLGRAGAAHTEMEMGWMLLVVQLVLLPTNPRYRLSAAKSVEDERKIHARP